ncbi:MAG: glycoside hydrolase family 2 TIM barrel-domain containing protein, partial [Bacteroidota bacterium]|nr:glycoside hydrolase family 2 TIM barrel-domain containing protein [Bacteroidota bacterium]
GWDCAPVVRDRNMGLYQDVFIEATGDVAIENPYVVTTLPLPDTTQADIRIKAELRNTSNKEIKGFLTGKIDLISDLVFPSYTKHLGGSMPSILVKKEVSLKANETKEIQLSPEEFKALLVHNPYLWYPNGYGKQYLHKLKLTFETAGKSSDIKEVTFGIRQVTSNLKQIGNDYGRVFYVNGKRIFCKGGWIQPDLLLDMNRKRVFDEARLMAEANVNIVGCEDAPSPMEDVMESYDKYGLMYWEVFFQCWRMYPGNESAHNHLDHQLATNEVKDIMKRYRNHPSIIAWFAANEVMVDEDLYTSTRKAVKELDETRPFIPTTSIDWDAEKLTPYLKADLPTGTTDDGAPDYNWNPQPYYFDKIREVHKQMFRNELGAPSVPTYSSLKKFIPTVTLPQSPASKNPIFPLDSIWAEHGAWDGPNYCFRAYDNAIRTLYGNPTSAEQYAMNAQYVSADNYRAMFEAANHRMWDITSGVMIWKLNSCWPDVCWQIYDWYLNPNAAYYFARKAMEPVHIQLNANDRKLSIINATHKKLQNVVVTAKMIDLEMQTKWTFTDTLSVDADCYKESVTIPKILPISSVYLVKLELKKTDGSLISDNLYWYCSQHEDFSPLTTLKKASLTKDISIQETGKEYKITVRLNNPSDKLSFFNRLVINKGDTKEEVLPTFWSDNFVTLFPHEEKTLTAIIAKDDLQGQKPVVEIE